MKDLLLRTLRHESTERAPWVPFAGVHAGHLKGYTATEMLTDADKAFESLMEVNRLYKPDGQPVIFDLQIEAECLGCGLKFQSLRRLSVRLMALCSISCPHSTHLLPVNPCP